MISGGGNAVNLKLVRFGPALRWMLYEAMDSGLLVEPFKVGKWEAAMHTPSMNWFWKLFEAIPFRRLSYSTDVSEHTERRWVLFYLFLKSKYT